VCCAHGSRRWWALTSRVPAPAPHTRCAANASLCAPAGLTCVVLNAGCAQVCGLPPADVDRACLLLVQAFLAAQPAARKPAGSPDTATHNVRLLLVPGLQPGAWGVVDGELCVCVCACACVKGQWLHSLCMWLAPVFGACCGAAQCIRDTGCMCCFCLGTRIQLLA